MLKVFQKRRKKQKGVSLSAILIFAAIKERKSYDYVSGMINFTYAYGAINDEERKALIQYLVESV